MTLKVALHSPALSTKQPGRRQDL